MAAQLILGFKLTDSMVFEGGVIWQSGEVNDVGSGSTAAVSGRSWKQDTWSYYIGFGWSPAKNVFIVPEFGIIDYNKLEVDGANTIDYGKHLHRFSDEQKALNCFLMLHPVKMNYELLPKEFYQINYDNGDKVWNGEDIKISVDPILFHSHWTIGDDNRMKLLEMVRKQVK